MYQAIAHFSYQHFEQDPVMLISQILNQWRLNGQVIGREMGVTHHQFDTHSEFQVRVALPEQDSLLPKWNNDWVNEALLQAEESQVCFEYFELLGRDYQAEETSSQDTAFQLLYTTHLDTCSPIYNGTDFCPMPLYRFPFEPELNEQLIQWQENWQACDQLQMNGGALEAQALAQIAELDSELSEQGRALAREIEQQTNIPTYYYLYRLGDDPEIEHGRHCPSCQQPWKLAEPLHQIFHFKCDQCRLVSNLSWALL